MNSVLKPLKLPIITKQQRVVELVQEELSQTPLTLVQLTDRNQLTEFQNENDHTCVLVEVTEDSDTDLCLIGELHVNSPDLQIIALSSKWTVHNAVQAIKRGAVEICDLLSDKGLITSAIQQALQAVRNNTRQLHDLIPKKILEMLSSDEARILTLLIQGRTTKEVGATLDVSVRTIHYRKKTLLRKLGVQSRSEAIEMIRLANGSYTFL